MDSYQFRSLRVQENVADGPYHSFALYSDRSGELVDLHFHKDYSSWVPPDQRLNPGTLWVDLLLDTPPILPRHT